MQRLRRSVERSSTVGQSGALQRTAMNPPDLMGKLNELIAALDRRLPRAGGAGERDIARDAARLRARAVERLAEVTDESAEAPRERLRS